MKKKYSRRKESSKIPGRKWAENRIGKYKVSCDGVGNYFVKKKDATRFKNICNRDPIRKALNLGNAKIKTLRGSYY